MKYKTIKEAAQNWVREFNAIPYSIIEKLLKGNIDELNEITPPAINDRVYLWERGEHGEIIEADGEALTVELDNGETINTEVDEIEVQRDGFLPMWGTLWAFSDGCDNYWIEELGGLQAMANCGFRIYEQEDYTYIFGIDGAGYDFYEAHWIPLYKARGLKWHKEAEEDSEK
jgi:hypothetical protein